MDCSTEPRTDLHSEGVSIADMATNDTSPCAAGALVARRRKGAHKTETPVPEMLISPHEETCSLAQATAHLAAARRNCFTTEVCATPGCSLYAQSGVQFSRVTAAVCCGVCYLTTGRRHSCAQSFWRAVVSKIQSQRVNHGVLRSVRKVRYFALPAIADGGRSADTDADSDDTVPDDDVIETDRDLLPHSAGTLLDSEPYPLESEGASQRTVALRVPTAPVPRFTLAEIRPLQVTFCDTKKYPTPGTNGKSICFGLIDLKTRMIFIRHLRNKTSIPDAFLSVACESGMNKTAFRSVCYTDGDGAMRPVSTVAARIGVHVERTPPYLQSLNESEKIMNTIFSAARALMYKAQAPKEYFMYAIKYSAYVHNYMSTTASRDYLSPHELLRGIRPSVAHLVPFFTLRYCHIPKDARKDKHVTAARARFLGFQSTFSKTAKCVLDATNRVVHTKSVQFDFSNRSADVPVPVVDATAVDAVDLPGTVGQAEGALGCKTHVQSGKRGREGSTRDDNSLFGSAEPFPTTPDTTTPSQNQTEASQELKEAEVVIEGMPTYTYDHTKDVGPHGTPEGESPPWRNLALPSPTEIPEGQLRSGTVRGTQLNMAAEQNARQDFIQEIWNLRYLDASLQGKALEQAIKRHKRERDSTALFIGSAFMATQSEKGYLMGQSPFSRRRESKTSDCRFRSRDQSAM